MMKITRYDILPNMDFNEEQGSELVLDIEPDKDGEWVKYSDIEDLLERSDNSNYAVPPTASPKLPSLNEVIKAVSYTNMLPVQITAVYNAIRKLGNFS